MLTLKKVKEMVKAPAHTKRVPSPKVLLEEGRIFLHKEFEHGSHLTLYHNGYVWFSAGKRNTVFHIHDCRGDYAYGASKGKGEVIKEEYFENCEWHIRALFEGEQRVEESQLKCEGVGQTKVSVSYHAVAEDWGEMADSEINVLDTLVNYCIEKKSIFYTVYYSLISVIGIGMCGGKTGLVLIAVEFALLYVNKKGLKYFIIVAAAVYWAYGYGLLDTVIGRFIAGFESGDITTGRNTALLRVIQGGVLRFNLLIGHAGMNLSERMIAALEYPPLRWAYLFGVWFSVLMCVVLFAIPAIKILKNKNIIKM